MTRNNKSTTSGLKSSQSHQTHATSKEKQPQEAHGSTKPIRLDASKSTGVDVASANSQSFSVPEKRTNEKKQTTLTDDGLGNLIAEYDIYINQPEKRLMLLQYPNRDFGQPYSDKFGLKPLELRMKPKCGVVEVDVPMIVQSNFNKDKGVRYGQAMRKSRVLQEGGSYGLTGGLRGGNPATRLRSSNQNQNLASEEPSHEYLLENFEDANNKGHVMNKLTLGGRIVPREDGYPVYYLGVFKGSA